jgi:hypothetical protein
MFLLTFFSENEDNASAGSVGNALRERAGHRRENMCSLKVVCLAILTEYLHGNKLASLRLVLQVIILIPTFPKGMHDSHDMCL